MNLLRKRSLDLKEKVEAFRAAEIAQVWTQYRHVDDSRMKLFTAMMTVTIAAIGFGITLSKSLIIPTETYFVGMLFFSFVLFFFNVGSWATFAHYDILLAEYIAILSETRHVELGINDKGIDAVAIGKKMPSNVQNLFFGSQSIFTLIAFVASFIFILLFADIAIEAFFSGHKIISPIYELLVLFFAIAIAMISVAVICFHLRVRSYLRRMQLKVWMVELRVGTLLVKPVLVRAVTEVIAKDIALSKSRIKLSGYAVGMGLAPSDIAKMLPDDQLIIEL